MMENLSAVPLEEGSIVIARPDRIGDVVISTSCLEPIREKFPERRIYILAAELMRPLLENHPVLSGFISLSSDLTSELKKTGAAAIVHLHPNADCYRAASAAGIPIRIGYGRPCRELTHTITDRRAEGLQHEAEYCFDLLQVLGIEKPARLRPSIHLPNADKASLQRKLPWDLETTRFALLNTSAHSAKREWPNQHLLDLADEVERQFTLPVVFVGADVREDFDGAHFNFSGRTTLGEISWLVRYAKVLVTTDTGTCHLAAALNCPSVVIFGRTDPEYGPVRWRPLSERTKIVTSPASRRRFETTRAYWRRSFAAIEVESVMAALRELLEQSRATANSLPKNWG
jgi:ADP-heptose:LPS heptosyltransferase